MIETKYKVLEYNGEEIEDFEIKFESNARVRTFYKGEEIKRIIELNITPRKVEIKTKDFEVKE